MTPVLMALKAAAQQAYDAVSRASEDVCGRDVYKNSTRQIRKNLRISGVRKVLRLLRTRLGIRLKGSGR
jgi:hypothetical protein